MKEQTVISKDSLKVVLIIFVQTKQVDSLQISQYDKKLKYDPILSDNGHREPFNLIVVMYSEYPDFTIRYRQAFCLTY